MPVTAAGTLGKDAMHFSVCDVDEIKLNEFMQMVSQQVDLWGTTYFVLPGSMLRQQHWSSKDEQGARDAPVIPRSKDQGEEVRRGDDGVGEGSTKI